MNSDCPQQYTSFDWYDIVNTLVSIGLLVMGETPLGGRWNRDKADN